MPLTNIEYGSLASSEVMNDNFSYLDDRITTVASNLSTTSSGIYSNIASMNSTITGQISDINSDIDDLEADITDLQTAIGSLSFVPDYTSKTTVSSPYTATEDCFIANYGSQGYNGSTSMSINSVQVWKTGGGLDASQSTTWLSPPFLIKTGDVVSGNTLYKYDIG